ncbi:TerB N-terminal domain-containing protein, partial [Enterococcus faecalis]|uniref:TerB N-terminal domain-containing protein n=2 Tax=Bacillati TaxID=1783272 RepID=UPI003D6B99A2
MLYVGRQLAAAVGYGPDPALIDPRLPLDFRRPDWAAGSVGYWPSYSDITPGARAAYLTWLADGRRAPNA